MAAHQFDWDWVAFGPISEDYVYVHERGSATEITENDDIFWWSVQAPTEQALNGLIVAAGKTELPFSLSASAGSGVKPGGRGGSLKEKDEKI